MTKAAYKVLILGGGAGGISVAARLKNTLPAEAIAIIEPSERHYYQPYWTLAGAGVVTKESSQKDEAGLIPTGVTWIKEKVLSIDPEAQKVHLSHDLTVGYEFLIVATGLKLNWDSIRGLEGQLGRNGICSIYEYDQLDTTANLIQNFREGKALFVMPPTPIKCAGAPQKIMYLADDIFKKNGVREKCDIHFASAGKAIFGIPTFAEPLAELVKEKNIHTHFNHKIVGVDASRKVAIFEVTSPEGKLTEEKINYDLLHVVPSMSAHSFISESALAFHEGEQKGWLAVDKHTLQHLKYPNIFGIGDVTGIPNSKTGAAIRKQYPIVAKNLLAVMAGRAPAEKYNGYSSCPIVTEVGKVMLAEFGYDGVVMPSFPLNPAIPRTSMWILKKYLLPKMYWYGMLKGLV